MIEEFVKEETPSFIRRELKHALNNLYDMKAAGPDTIVVKTSEGTG